MKEHKILSDNLTIQKHENKTLNRLTFKIKSGYYPELSIPGTMKLF